MEWFRFYVLVRDSVGILWLERVKTRASYRLRRQRSAIYSAAALGFKLGFVCLNNYFGLRSALAKRTYGTITRLIHKIDTQD
jgi:hypothetical protein